MLALRRGVVAVVERDPGCGAEQSLLVDLADGRHPAIADTVLVGVSQPGDEVIVSVAARELGLGSGGFDIVHVNLTRGLAAAVSGGPAVMKLNYTSVQHAVRPLERNRPLDRSRGGHVVVLGLHGQLAPVVWALAQANPGLRVGYVQTAGGALPGSRSGDARELRRRRLLAAHVTAGPSYGGPDGDAITTIGAVDHGLSDGWDVAVCGPGPGIIGSASTLGHGGMAALDSAHAALSLGAATTLVLRMSQADRRERHQGISHHSRTVLELLLAPVTVARPAGVAVPDWGARHDWRTAAADLAGYAASGLPATTMGRSIDDDPLFFAAALVAGRLVGGGHTGESSG